MFWGLNTTKYSLVEGIHVGVVYKYTASWITYPLEIEVKKSL